MEMLIGGAWLEADSGRWMEVENPATGAVLDRVPRGGEEDARAAIEAAEEAFDEWASLAPRARGKILSTGVQQVREHADSLARLLTSEQGKPLSEAKNEILGFANVLEYYHAISGSIRGEFVHLPAYGYACVTRRPLGVCGAIIPWNMPAIIMAWKVGAALVAGNTLILKPASSTPLTNLRLAALLHDAGLPPGVLNVVTGEGETVGEEIASHRTVRKVSFTGNATTGRRVAANAARSMKDLTLELGGSDPMIVCEDAHIRSAVEGAVHGRFYNCGQTCTAVKRLFIVDTIADEFISQLIARVSTLSLGNGINPGTDMGPLNSAPQRERIRNLMRTTVEQDEGRLLLGGGIPKGELFENGCFFEPTLVTDVAPESPLLTEEIFGPVLPVMVVKDLEEAVEKANLSPYALGASIWTRNIEALVPAFEHVNAGMVWINQHLRVPPEVPFGGFEASGKGRENGYGALERYLDTKTVIIKPQHT